MADIVISVGGDVRPLASEINKIRKKKLDLDLGGLGKFKNPLGRITGNLGEFEKALEASNARVIAFGASAGALFAVQKGLRAVVESSIDVEKRLSDINVILNVSGKSLERFSNNLFSVARNTGSAFADVADAATELSRQGLSVEQTLQRTSDALILTRLSGMKAAESVNALTAALNSFSRAAITSTEYVSKLAAVDAAFAVSSEDLAKAVSRVGSSAQDAGLGIDELIAAVTAAQQVTARGGAVIGNSFKTIFTRIQRPKVLEELENLGIAVRDMTGNTKPAMQILKSLAVQFDNLAASQRAQIAELVGGVFQVNVLKASLRDLGKEFSLYGNALDISNKATDEAERRNEQLNKTLSANLNKTQQNLHKFGAQVGAITFGPAMKKVLGGINSAIQDFDLKKPDGIGEKIGAGVLGGLGKFLEGPGLLVVGMTLVKTFSRVAKQMTDAFKTIAGIGRAGDHQVQTQQKVLQLMQQNPQILEQIENGELSVVQAHRKILSLIDLENKALRNEVNIVKELSSLLSSSGARVKGTLGGGSALALSGGPALKNKGNIPNYSKKDKAAKNQELRGASYAKKNTKAVKDSMPGLGTYYRNTAEEKISGSKTGHTQDWINPPKSSPEGKQHRVSAIKRTGIDPYNLNTGFIPNFASKSEITAANKAMSFIPTKVITGETMHESQTADKTTKRLDTEMFGLRPASVKSFHNSAGKHYGNMVRNTTDDVFGSNYNKGSWRFMPEKKNFSQVMGSALQDMIGGLTGARGGAGGAGVDLAGGVEKIWKNHGSMGIDKRFTPGLFDNAKTPTEIKSRIGTVVGTKDKKGNWSVNPADMIKKGAISYAEHGGDMGGFKGTSAQKANQLTDIMKNLGVGHVPNFAPRKKPHGSPKTWDKLFTRQHFTDVGHKQSSISWGKHKQNFTTLKGRGDYAMGNAPIEGPGAKETSFRTGPFKVEGGKKKGVTAGEWKTKKDKKGGKKRVKTTKNLADETDRFKATLKFYEHELTKKQLREEGVNWQTFEDQSMRALGFNSTSSIGKFFPVDGLTGDAKLMGESKFVSKIGPGEERASPEKILGKMINASLSMGLWPDKPSFNENKKEVRNMGTIAVAGTKGATSSMKLAKAKSGGHVPNFASAKGRATPLYDLDGTIINEGFFDWKNPEKVSRITAKDLTPLGSRLVQSQEIVDIATARDRKSYNPINQALASVGINVGKVMPLASMFTSQKKKGILKPLVNLTGPDKKRKIADELDRPLVDNDPKNIDALGDRGILYSGEAGGFVPNYGEPLTMAAAALLVTGRAAGNERENRLIRESAGKDIGSLLTEKADMEKVEGMGSLQRGIKDNWQSISAASLDGLSTDANISGVLKKKWKSPIEAIKAIKKNMKGKYVKYNKDFLIDSTLPKTNRSQRWREGTVKDKKDVNEIFANGRFPLGRAKRELLTTAERPNLVFPMKDSNLNNRILTAAKRSKVLDQQEELRNFAKSGKARLNAGDFFSAIGQDQVNSGTGIDSTLHGLYAKIGNGMFSNFEQLKSDEGFWGKAGDIKEGAVKGVKNFLGAVSGNAGKILGVSGGSIPNFATGIYDSDKIGDRGEANKIIDNIIKTNSYKHVFHGPAGSGKTTAARKRYPDGIDILSYASYMASMGLDEANKGNAALFDKFAIVSGTTRGKKGQYSSRGQAILNSANKITAVIPPRDELMKRRAGRAAGGAAVAGATGDKRSPKQIAGSQWAAGPDYKLYSDLKKSGQNVDILRSGGFIPNFAMGLGKGRKLLDKHKLRGGDLGSERRLEKEGKGQALSSQAMAYLGQVFEVTPSILGSITPAQEGEIDGKGQYNRIRNPRNKWGASIRINKKSFEILNNLHIPERRKAFPKKDVLDAVAVFAHESTHALQAKIAGGLHGDEGLTDDALWASTAGNISPKEALNLLPEGKRQGAIDYADSKIYGERAKELGVYQTKAAQDYEKTAYLTGAAARERAKGLYGYAAGGFVPNFLATNAFGGDIESFGVNKHMGVAAFPGNDEFHRRYTVSKWAGTGPRGINPQSREDQFKIVSEVFKHASGMQGDWGNFFRLHKADFDNFQSKINIMPEAYNNLIEYAGQGAARDFLNGGSGSFSYSTLSQAGLNLFPAFKDLMGEDARVAAARLPGKAAAGGGVAGPALGGATQAAPKAAVRAGLIPKKFGRKAGGHVPNFADPLSEAISRESKSVPGSTIRIGQHGSLKSSSNPGGIGVYNTRHEPRGIAQGINRAKKEGRNPKTYGASKGSIPNFAATVDTTEASAALRSSGASEAAINKLLKQIHHLGVNYERGSAGHEQETAAAMKLAEDEGITGDALEQYKKVIDKTVELGKKENSKNKKGYGERAKDFFTKPADESKNVGQRMLALSFAVPQVTEMFKQFGGEMGQTTTAAIDGISNFGMTFSGISSMLPGPGGQLAAMMVAGAGAISKFAKDFQATSKELVKKAEKSKEKFTELQNNLTAYSQTFSELKKAAEDYNTPAKAIFRLQKKLNNLTNSLPSDLAMEMMTMTDPSKLQDRIAEEIAKKGRNQASLETSANLAQAQDKQNSVIGGLTKWIDFGGVGDVMAKEMRKVFKGAEGQLQFDRLLADMKKGLDFGKLSENSMDAAKAQGLASMSNEKFVSTLGNTYGASENLQLVLRDLASSELKEFREGLMASARAAQRQKAAMDKIQKVQRDESARLGIGELQRSISILGKNVEMEAEALKKLGGGIEGFKDPSKVLGPLTEKVLSGAKEVASVKPGSPGTEEGRAAAVKRGQGALSLAEGLFDQGMFIPQLDASTGKLDESGRGIRDAIVDGMEAAARKTGAATIKALTKQQKKAKASGNLKGAELLGTRIQQITKQLTTQEGKSMMRRGFEGQVNERFGVDEMKLKEFRLGSVARGPAGAGATQQERDAVRATQDTTSLGESLRLQGVEDSKQIAIVMQTMKRRIQDNLENIDKELKEKGLDPEKKKELEKKKGKLEAAKATLGKSDGASQITLKDIRELTGATSKEGIFTGGAGAVSISGEGETIGERKLREAQDKLREATKKLRETVEAAAKKETDKETGALLEEAKEDIKQDKDKNVSVLTDLIDARGSSDVLGDKKGGFFGDVADLWRGGADALSEGGNTAYKAESAAMEGTVQGALKHVQQIVAGLGATGEIDSIEELKSLNSESKDVKDVMGKLGITLTGQGKKLLNASFGESDNPDAAAANKFLGEGLTYGQKSLTVAKQTLSGTDAIDESMQVLRAWDNPTTCAVTIHAIKDALFNSFLKSGLAYQKNVDGQEVSGLTDTGTSAAMVGAAGVTGGVGFGAKKGYNRAIYGSYDKANRSRNLLRGMPGGGGKISDTAEAERRLSKIKKPGTTMFGFGGERMFDKADITKILDTDAVKAFKKEIATLEEMGKGGTLDKLNPLSDINKAKKGLAGAQAEAAQPIIKKGVLGRGWKKGVAKEGQKILKELDLADEIARLKELIETSKSTAAGAIDEASDAAKKPKLKIPTKDPGTGKYGFKTMDEARGAVSKLKKMEVGLDAAIGVGEGQIQARKAKLQGEGLSKWKINKDEKLKKLVERQKSMVSQRTQVLDARKGIEEIDKGARAIKQGRETAKLAGIEKQAAAAQEAADALRKLKDELKVAEEALEGLKKASRMGSQNILGIGDANKFASSTARGVEGATEAADFSRAAAGPISEAVIQAQKRVDDARLAVQGAEGGLEIMKISEKGREIGRAATAGEKFMNVGRSPVAKVLGKGLKDAWKMGDMTKSLFDFGKTIDLSQTVGRQAGGAGVMARGLKKADAGQTIGTTAKAIEKITRAKGGPALLAKPLALVAEGSKLIEKANFTKVADEAAEIGSALAKSGDEAVVLSRSGAKVAEFLAKGGKIGDGFATTLGAVAKVGAGTVRVLGAAGKLAAAPGVGLLLGGAVGMGEKAGAKDYERQLKEMSWGKSAGMGFATGSADTGGFLAQDVFGLRKDAGKVGEWNMSDKVGVAGAGLYGGAEAGLSAFKLSAGNPWVTGAAALGGAAGSMYFEHKKVKERHARQKQLLEHDPMALVGDRMAEYMDNQAEIGGGDFGKGGSWFGNMGSRTEHSKEIKEQAISYAQKSYMDEGMGEKEARAKAEKTIQEETRPAALHKIAQLEGDKRDFELGNMDERSGLFNFGGREQIAGDSQRAKEEMALIDQKIKHLKESNELTEEDNKVIAAIVKQNEDRERRAYKFAESIEAEIGDSLARINAQESGGGGFYSGGRDAEGNKSTFEARDFLGLGAFSDYFFMGGAKKDALEKGVEGEEKLHQRAAGAGKRTMSKGMGIAQAVAGTGALQNQEFAQNLKNYSQSGQYSGAYMKYQQNKKNKSRTRDQEKVFDKLGSRLLSGEMGQADDLMMRRGGTGEKFDTGLSRMLRDLQARKAAGGQISEEEIRKLGHQGAGNLEKVFSQKLSQNKYAKAGGLLGSMTSVAGGTNEEKMANLKKIFEEGFLKIEGKTTAEARTEEQGRIQIEKAKAKAANYAADLKGKAGIEDQKTYDQRAKRIKEIDTGYRAANPEEKKNLEAERSQLLKEKVGQDKKRQVFAQNAQMAVGGGEYRESLGQTQDLYKTMRNGARGIDENGMIGPGGVKAIDEAAFNQNLVKAVADWRAMGEKEKTAAEEKGLTAEQTFAKSAVGTQDLWKRQQQMAAKAGTSGNRQMNARIHARMGTKGVDYRAGVSEEMFGEVVTKNFGADVAKRIQQRKEMLTTGQVEGKKLTGQQKQQVAAAQQREMQGLYQRGAATGKEGGFNEMLRESIVKAFEARADAEKKEKEETNAKETGKDKPAAEGGGKPKEEGEGGVETKATTEGKFTHNVNVTGRIDTDALTTSLGEAIEIAVQDAFNNLGADGKKAHTQAESKKHAKTKDNTGDFGRFFTRGR